MKRITSTHALIVATCALAGMSLVGCGKEPSAEQKVIETPPAEPAQPTLARPEERPAAPGRAEMEPADRDAAATGTRETVDATAGGDTVRPVSGAERDPSAARGPRLSFEQTDLDLGVVWDVEQPVGRFVFTNNGDEPLLISDIRGSEGCSVAPLARTTVQPGASATIEATFHPQGRRRQVETITIASNARQGRMTRLEMSAEVMPLLTFEPDPLNLGVVTLGAPHTAALTIASSAPRLEVESIEADDERLRARVVSPGEGGAPPSAGAVLDRREVEVTLDERAGWGGFQGRLTLHVRAQLTEGGPLTAYARDVRIAASVFGEVHADRTSFQVASVPPGESFERAIRITRPSGDPFRVLGATIGRSTAGGLDVRALPIDETGVNGYYIILSGVVDRAPGVLQGEVTVTTDVAGEESLVLPFSGLIREVEK